MSTSPARIRALNEQKPPHDIVVTATGEVTCPYDKPVLRLTAASTYGITGFNMRKPRDGFTIEVLIKTGSSTLTITETGNIKTTGSSLALGANDNAKFRYDSGDATWYQIATTNH